MTDYSDLKLLGETDAQMRLERTAEWCDTVPSDRYSAILDRSFGSRESVTQCGHVSDGVAWFHFFAEPGHLRCLACAEAFLEERPMRDRQWCELCGKAGPVKEFTARAGFVVIFGVCCADRSCLDN